MDFLDLFFAQVSEFEGRPRVFGAARRAWPDITAGEQDKLFQQWNSKIREIQKERGFHSKGWEKALADWNTLALWKSWGLTMPSGRFWESLEKAARWLNIEGVTASHWEMIKASLWEETQNLPEKAKWTVEMLGKGLGAAANAANEAANKARGVAVAFGALALLGAGGFLYWKLR